MNNNFYDIFSASDDKFFRLKTKKILQNNLGS